MPPKRKYWLVKSEPDVFSFDDLMRANKRTTLWDGVRNYTARNFMRDEMRKGDGVLYYHSNAKPPGIAGLARVAREGYPDPTQFDPASKYYDAGSDPEDPRWILVDVQGLEALPRFLPLDELRAKASLGEMALVQRGQRLSVQPVRAAEWRTILRMAGAVDPFRS